jgi:hypothetical protein
MVNGLDQGAASGTLLAHDEQGDMGWVSATFTDPVSGVRFIRTVVVLADHVIDELTWVSDADVVVDLPLQAALRADRSGAAWRPATSPPLSSTFLSAVQTRPFTSGDVVTLSCAALPSPAVDVVGEPPAMFELHLWSHVSAELWSAATIGPPAGQPHGMVVLQQRGQHGRTVRLIATSGSALQLQVDDACITVHHPDGSVARHQRVNDAWTVHTREGTTMLRGARTGSPAPLEPPVSSARPTVLTVGESVTAAIELGESNYRGTEATWHESGEPTATVWVTHLADHPQLSITIAARLNRASAFAPPSEENPLDNELPDVNSDGAQLHWRGADGVWNGVLAVPENDGVRLSAVTGTLDGLTAQWSLQATGFSITFLLDWPGPDRDLEFDCCVNERPEGRERRRGQLVLSGANGESAYLRGARQGPERAITLRFQHPSS